MKWKQFLCLLRFELSVQVKTKAFWLIALIPPLAMVLMFVANHNSRHIDNVLVNNSTSLNQPLASTPTMEVKYGVNENWKDEGFDAYVCLSQTGGGEILCCIHTINALNPENVSSIKDHLETKMAESNLGINLAEVKQHESDKISIEMVVENPRQKLLAFSMAGVFLIYLIVLQFAGSILKITGREKTNKICEILLSAIPSRIIMAGKLTACLVAAFLQIIVWCVIGILAVFLSDKIWTEGTYHQAIEALIKMFSQLPKEQLVEFVLVYMLFLIGGFLLYCILFSILGAISNENTNTQQFSLILTLPLLLTFIYVIGDFGGETELLTWLSYIPFSSPIAAVPVAGGKGVTWQILCSLLILYITIFVVFHYSCTLYEKGALVSKSKVTVKTLMRCFSK